MTNLKRTPLVSVIMGIYNSKNKKELIRSLKSIQSQSLTDWECIICDDHSEDDTYDFLIQYTRNDSRFIIIKNEKNMGLGFSLNKALEKAKAPYIIRQDVDDYSSQNRFEKLYLYMEEHREIDVLGTGMVLYDEDGEWGNYKIRTLNAKKNDFLIGTVVAHPSVIMRTKSLRACDGYRIARETRRCEDYDLFMRMYAKGYKICNIDEQLYYYKANRNGNKRKFKNVINESIVRAKGFKILGIGIKGFPYIMKPYILYFVPDRLKKRIKGA